MHSRAASRYAKALYEVLKTDPKKNRSVVSELGQFADLMQSNHELSFTLTCAIFPQGQQRQIIEDIAAKAKLSRTALGALLVLSESRRLRELRRVVEKLHLLTLEGQGVVPLRVASATELSLEEKEKIETRFKTFLGHGVEAQYELDASLIGGLRVTAAGRTYDGSVGGWLSHFEEKLAGGHI